MRNTIILGLLALVVSFCMSLTYNFTKTAIEEVKKAEVLEGFVQVMPEFDNFPAEDTLELNNSTVYVGRKDGVISGYAVISTSPKGYGGDIEVLAGFTTEGTVNAVKILSQKETPGLGDTITFANFLAQFGGISHKNKVALTKYGGQIDYTSGATISPKAVTDALNAAFDTIGEVSQ